MNELPNEKSNLAGNLRNVNIPSRSSSLPTDADWETREAEKKSAEFFSRVWPLSEAPARAYQRIVKSCFEVEEWKRVDTEIGRILRENTGSLLMLAGPRGTGKTQLGVCAMYRMCQARCTVRYIKALDFFISVKETYSAHAKDTERDIIKRFCRPRLMVIDGIEERAETAWENRLLNLLIDHRYDDLTSTILITNQMPSEGMKSLGPSASSRLRETGGVLLCEWPSFRE